MKTISISVFVTIFVVCTGSSQSIKYDAASIPDSLKKDVSLVKRYESTLFEVSDIDRTSTKIHRVYTILDKNGERALHFQEYSNSFRQLNDVEIKVYDENGKQTSRYKRKDLYTRAVMDGLIDDYKGHFFIVPTTGYPVTVEYIYDIKSRGTLLYPKFEIVTPGESVEASGFTARVPKNLDLRYKEQNIRLAPEVIESGEYKTYNWAVKNIKPIEYEEGSVSYESRYPNVLLAPNKFKMDSYEGDMSTWEKFGLWETNMQKGLEALPEERKKFFTELVKDATTEREKVKTVYHYLQKNFRYVSIQMGIGGYKPFAADFTDKKKYGDCKGLSFYMHSVLNALGIKSHTALINSDYNKAPVNPDFPVNDFNHMILCVPLQKDTVWLECTSNTSEFGVLGNSTENRNALLITEKGGVLVSTPKSKSSDNTFSAYSIVKMGEDGGAVCTTDIRASGEYKQELSHFIDAKRDDQKLYLVRRWGFKHPDDFSFQGKDSTNGFVANVVLSVEKVPEFTSGTKMFLPIQIYTGLLTYKLPKSEKRRLDYYFENPFEDRDTTVFKLPANFTIDVLPQAKSFSCEYASFSSKYWYDETEKAVYTTVSITLTQHIIPASKYSAVKTFFDAVHKESMQRIVIKKTN